MEGVRVWLDQRKGGLKQRREGRLTSRQEHSQECNDPRVQEKKTVIVSMQKHNKFLKRLGIHGA